MSATAVVTTPHTQPEEKRKSSFAFKAVMAISVLYYARPEDVIPGLGVIPMVKIAGVLAVIALFFGMREHRAVKKIPVENKLHLVLFGQMVFSIPFAYWMGGAFNTVFFRVTKGVIVMLLVAMLVTSFRELKRLLWIQAASMSIMTIASIAQHNRNSRMTGALGGVFENPNDLAINIALNWPLCFAFYLNADKAWKKAFWALSMFVMVIGVFLTYSRSGFLAMGLCALISLYYFGLKGKRVHLIAVAVLAVVFLGAAAPLFGLYPGIWLARMESSVLGNVENSYDRGSKEARTELLRLSLKEMATHPLTGVGPGNFQIFGDWHVAHNTYSEIGAEAGVPALLLFLAILGRAFWNLRRSQKSDEFKRNPELRLFTGAMIAYLGAYLVGAAFSSTQYELFPYFMVAYTTVLYHMACVFPQTAAAVTGASAENRQSADGLVRPPRQAAWL